jgi:hypothetical protein
MSQPTVTPPGSPLRSILKSQYHAALAMLRETIELCPDDVWYSDRHTNSFWQIAYHTLFFTHLYLQQSEADFVPWEHHQAQVQHADGIAGRADPNSDLPLIPDPYTRSQALAYWLVCDQMVDEAVDALDLESPVRRAFVRRNGPTRFVARAASKSSHSVPPAVPGAPDPRWMQC